MEITGFTVSSACSFVCFALWIGRWPCHSQRFSPQPPRAWVPSSRSFSLYGAQWLSCQRYPWSRSWRIFFWVHSRAPCRAGHTVPQRARLFRFCCQNGSYRALGLFWRGRSRGNCHVRSQIRRWRLSRTSLSQRWILLPVLREHGQDLPFSPTRACRSGTRP